MQHDSKYPSPSAHPVSRASSAAGVLVAWVLIGLVGVLAASGILAGIVALWRVILG